MRHVFVALLALYLVACSSAPGSPVGHGGQGGSGGVGGTTASGGAGGSAGSGGRVGSCGAGDQDCLCPGGTFECVNDRTTCVCPRECTRTDECASDEVCFFYDGNCGSAASGYCRSLAQTPQSVCAQAPACGCDGKRYQNGCAAVAALVSPSAAPTTDCASRPQPCTDSASGVSCYPSQYCRVQNANGSVSAWCDRFDAAACAQPSCSCLSYNADTCSCEQLPSGLVRLTCRI